MNLNLDTANAMIAQSILAADNSQAHVSISVVDLTGRLLALARMPGAGPLTADISHTKATTAVLLGGDTRDFTAAAALATAVDQPLALIPGGVLLRDADGNPIGGVGVAGAAPDIDDAVARAATVPEVAAA